MNALPPFLSLCWSTAGSDLVIGGKHMLAGKDLGIGQKTTITVDRIIHGQFVAAADHVVILAMAGCRVYRTGTGFGSNMITQDHRHFDDRVHDDRLTRPEQVGEARYYDQSRTEAGGYS